MNRCYCKIIKKLEKLEKDLKQNTTNDSSLILEVDEIRRDLNINTLSDLELANKVDNIEVIASGNPLTVDINDITNLFNHG